MKSEMRQKLARLPYEEKLRRVAELIELSRRLKRAKPARAVTGQLKRYSEA
jgi:hypothetical protein